MLNLLGRFLERHKSSGLNGQFRSDFEGGNWN
jgi:hypothetical protein